VLAHAAKANADKEIVKELIRAGAETVTEDDLPPLITAALNGNVRVARCLLDGRANPNVQDHECHTAVHFAARNGDNRMIRLLTQSRADVNAQDYNGLLPVQFSMNNQTTQQLFQLGSHQGLGGPGLASSTAKLSISLPQKMPGFDSPGSASPPSSPCSGPVPRRHRTVGGAISAAAASIAAAPHARGSAPCLGNFAAGSGPVANAGTPKALSRSPSAPTSPKSPISLVARSVAATP